jgi:hypothetical protein
LLFRAQRSQVVKALLSDRVARSEHKLFTNAKICAVCRIKPRRIGEINCLANAKHNDVRLSRHGHLSGHYGILNS